MKTVVLVGKAKGFEKAYEETDCEIWSVSTALKVLKLKPDKLFQLHKENVFEPWLENWSDRLVTMKEVSQFHSEVLPREKLIAMFGPSFNGSIPWMIGYAILLGFELIKIYGVHMNGKGEYGHQRDSTFYMMGQAEARGVRVEVPADSGLYLYQLYGME